MTVDTLKGFATAAADLAQTRLLADSGGAVRPFVLFAKDVTNPPTGCAFQIMDIDPPDAMANPALREAIIKWASSMESDGFVIVSDCWALRNVNMEMLRVFPEDAIFQMSISEMEERGFGERGEAIFAAGSCPAGNVAITQFYVRDSDGIVQEFLERSVIRSDLDGATFAGRIFHSRVSGESE